MEWIKDQFLLTDDARRVDVDCTFRLLRATYWGVRRPRDVVAQMIRHSLCFVLFRENLQVGFARAVTDYTAFSWIADLVIEAQHRGGGLGKWMMACIVTHPAIKDTQMVLQTRDAHTFYERYGFAKNPALMSTRVPGL